MRTSLPLPGTTPAVWHADPETLPCGACSHVVPDHPSDGGGPCYACCDGTGRCRPDEFDEDGNLILPPPCWCCEGFVMPPAPPGTPRTHGTGIHGQREDEVASTWGAIKVIARVLHAFHNPGMAIVTTVATEGGKAAWKGRQR